jgi:hypothetical protein
MVDTPRGRRIAKDKASHKIDVAVALAQAALGAVRGGQAHGGGMYELMRRRFDELVLSPEGGLCGAHRAIV